MKRKSMWEFYFNISIQLFLLVISAFALYFNQQSYSEVNGQTIFLISIICLSTYFLGFQLVYMRFSTVVFPYSFFLLLSLLFNSGSLIIYIIDSTKVASYSVFALFSGHNIANIILFQTICVISLNLGFCLSQLLVPKIGKLRSSEATTRSLKPAILASIFTLPFAILRIFSALSFRIRFGYSQDYYTSRVQDSWVVLGSELFLISMLYLLTVSTSRSKKGIKSLSLIVILVYCVFWLWIGERNKILVPVFGVLWILYLHRGFTKYWSKKRLLWASFIIPILLYSVYYSGRFRIYSFNDIKYEGSSITNVVTEPFFSVLNEMGGTLSTVGYTLIAFPSQFEYQNTYGYNSAQLLLPNSLLEIMNIKPPKILYLDRWLTSYVNREDVYLPNTNPAGTGFSYIAESYVNCGFFGPVAIMVIGMVYTWVALIGVRSLKKDRPLEFVLTTYICGTLLIYSRSDMVNVITYVVYAIYVLVLYKISNTLFRDSRKRRFQTEYYK